MDWKLLYSIGLYRGNVEVVLNVLTKGSPLAIMHWIKPDTQRLNFGTCSFATVNDRALSRIRRF